ncbi:hypothetical protein SteCoe_26113 [Stentor coeruleus]|uniref:Uncharacterized protein n=1 Tax=Stentor coeruleus TaxID=5963 RepID=A0A1R2BDP8_9CILI|nr:hypothetical protein SteCoe_26113 [Stentor coeruleus]
MKESRKRFLNQFSSSIFSTGMDAKIISTNEQIRSTSSYTHKITPKIGEYNSDNICVKKPSEIKTTIDRSLSSGRINYVPKYKKPLEIATLNSSSFPKPEDAKVETLQITGLHPHDNELVLKSMAKYCHIVDVNTEFDNVKGICTGRGSISIRSFPNENNKQRLALILKNSGYEVSDAAKSVKHKESFSQLYMSTKSNIREESAGERKVSKENIQTGNTPRYMQTTTSFAKKANYAYK